MERRRQLASSINSLLKTQTDTTALLESISNAMKQVPVDSIIPGGIPTEEKVKRWDRPVQYFEIETNNSFSLSVFLIRKGATIPIHDHPRMNVISRMLFGELRERSLDWLGDVQYSEDGAAIGTATVVKNRLRSGPTDIAVIGPQYGNLHVVEAMSTCAFLDCFLPPYNNGDRDCTYFKLVDLKEREADDETYDIAASDNESDESEEEENVKLLQQGQTVVLRSYYPLFSTGNYSNTMQQYG